MKMNSFQGDLTGMSAGKEPLIMCRRTHWYPPHNTDPCGKRGAWSPLSRRHARHEATRLSLELRHWSLASGPLCSLGWQTQLPSTDSGEYVPGKAPVHLLEGVVHPQHLAYWRALQLPAHLYSVILSWNWSTQVQVWLFIPDRLGVGKLSGS